MSSAAAATESPTLLDLARTKFPDLTKPEKKLCTDLQTSTEADFSDEVGKPWDEINPSKDDLPELRAEVLAWVLSDKEARGCLDHRGTSVFGARIIGNLSLMCIDFPSRLGIFHCHLPAGINIQDALFGAINFHGSHTNYLSADRVTVKGSVFLTTGFCSKGQVRFHGARIGGNLQCRKGTFENELGYALSADGIEVKGAAFLDDEFTATGQVRFIGATIGGNLECTNGTFHNESDSALNADGIEVRGSVLLKNGFSAKGEARFINAKIGGNLQCSKGTFENELGYALSADGIEVKGNVFLDAKFSAKGVVSLLGANIGGDLVCTGTFENGSEFALCAEQCHIIGNLFLEGSTILGNADFRSADIGRTFALRSQVWDTNSLLILSGAHCGTLMDRLDQNKAGIFGTWPAKGNLSLDGFTYDSIDDDAPKDVERRLRWIDLQPDDQYRPQPYEQLASVLRKAGHEVDAKKVLIAKNKKRLSYKKPFESGWLWLLLSGWVLDYGHRPQKALSWIGMLFILGTIIFGAAYLEGNIGPTHPAVAGSENCLPAQDADVVYTGSPIPISCPAFNPLYYAVDLSIPFLELGQVKHWQVRSRSSEWCALIRMYQFFHTVLGWLLVAALGFGLAGVIKQ